jgi:hypothetical protein
LVVVSGDAHEFGKAFAAYGLSLAKNFELSLDQ